MFRDVKLPDDKKVILGVIDVKTNYVEHPRLVADRLVQVGRFVGKDRLLAGVQAPGAHRRVARERSKLL